MKEQLNELALFAGAGGGILGSKLLGWRTVCAVEWDAYARDVLVARQNDGCLDPFPIWDDVQTFDGKPWRGRVDVVSGGFPCQDISCAGKGAGIDGERSGMWKHMARIIGEVLPQFAFVENSPMLVGRGLAVVISDLAEMGYDAKWGIAGAHHAGAPHKRDRIWIIAERGGQFSHAKHDGTGWREQQPQGTEEKAGDMANATSKGLEGSEWEIIQGGRNRPPNGRKDVADAMRERQPRQGEPWFIGNPSEKRKRETDYAFSKRVGHIWGIESPLGRVAHGVAARMDRLRCIGNGQVPAVAQLAWNTLKS